MFTSMHTTINNAITALLFLFLALSLSVSASPIPAGLDTLVPTNALNTNAHANSGVSDIPLAGGLLTANAGSNADTPSSFTSGSPAPLDLASLPLLSSVGEDHSNQASASASGLGVSESESGPASVSGPVSLLGRRAVYSNSNTARSASASASSEKNSDDASAAGSDETTMTTVGRAERFKARMRLARSLSFSSS